MLLGIDHLGLFAFFEANRQHRWWEPLQRGGGFVDFCLRTSDGVALAWRLAILEFLAPRAGHGPLAEWLAVCGTSPWALALRAPTPAGWLPPAKTHGARIRLG